MDVHRHNAFDVPRVVAAEQEQGNKDHSQQGEVDQVLGLRLQVQDGNQLKLIGHREVQRSFRNVPK